MDVTQEEDGWVTIKKKSLKKGYLIQPRCSDGVTENYIKKTSKPTFPSEVYESHSTTSNQANVIRKLKIKEEQRRIREEKQRALRESKRRDTKFSFISADTVSHFSSNGNNDRSSHSVQNMNNHILPSDESFMSNYPTLQNSQSKNKAEKKAVHKNKEGSNKAFEQKSNHASHELHLSNKKCQVSSKGKNSVSNSHSSNKSLLKKTSISYATSPRNKLKKQELSSASNTVTRNVKMKDAIIFNIIDLIQVQRKKVDKTKGPVHGESKRGHLHKAENDKSSPKKIVERRGKISENKKKKVTSLKRRLLKQRKMEYELLLKILNEHRLVQDDVAKENESSCVSLDQDSKHAVNLGAIPESDKLAVISTLNEKKINMSEDDNVRSETQANDEEEQSSEEKGVIDCLLKKLELLKNPIHKASFREYCDHVFTPEINEKVSELISLVVKFQDRLHQQDPIKAKMKRRYFCGLKETLKHINKLSCIVLAPNVQMSPGEGGIDELLNKVLYAANASKIAVIFALSRFKLGRLCKRRAGVSCVAIVNYQGAQDVFENVLELVFEAKKEYETLTNKIASNSTPDDPRKDDVAEQQNDVDGVATKMLQILKS